MKKGIFSALTVIVLCVCLLFGACDNGENGKSAYDVAVKNGFKGTEQQWLASLKGEKGDPGDKGDPGIRGSKFLAGEGNPSADIDPDLMEGDMYLDYLEGYIWSYRDGKWKALNVSEDEFLDAEGLKSRFESGNDITLRNDVTLTGEDILNVPRDNTMEFDLGGMTVGFGGNGSGDLAGIRVSGNLTISNGTLNFDSTTNKSGFSETSSPIIVESGATLTLNDVDFVSSTASGILAKENSTVNINDSRITTRVYCIGTNAKTSGYGAPESINITRSVLTASNENGDATPVLVNVSTNVTITDSTIKGDRQAVILRGCNATIENSTLESTGKFVSDETGTDNYLESDWKSGNEVPYATLVIGNRGSGYQYPTTVTLKKVTLITPDSADKSGNSDEPNGSDNGMTDEDKDLNGISNGNSKENKTNIGNNLYDSANNGKGISNGNSKENGTNIGNNFYDSASNGNSISNGNSQENGTNIGNNFYDSANNGNGEYGKNFTRYDGKVYIGLYENSDGNNRNMINEIGTEDSDNEVGKSETNKSSVLPLYVYGNDTEGNGVTLTMDAYTEAQAGEKFIFGENVTYNKMTENDMAENDRTDNMAENDMAENDRTDNNMNEGTERGQDEINKTMPRVDNSKGIYIGMNSASGKR